MKVSPSALVLGCLSGFAFLGGACASGGGGTADGAGGSQPGTGGRGPGSGGALGASGGTGGRGTGGASPSASGGATAGHTGGASSSSGGRGTGGNSPGGTGVGSSTGGSGTGGSGSGGTSGAASICGAGPFPAPMLAGLNPTRIEGVPPSDVFNNTRNNFSVMEGPVWTGDALYVTEIATMPVPPPGRILKVTPAGAVSIVVANAGVNGMALDGSGNLVGGNHKDGAITRFSFPGFAPSPIVTMFGGMRFNSPNDLAIRADGNLYFTDPDYQAPATRPQTKARLYRVAPGAGIATVIDENRNEPNGVTLSPDGNTLYVSGGDGLFRYQIAADGTVAAGTKIAPSLGSSDGMAVDCGGNLYIANSNGPTLAVVDPAGNSLGAVTVPGVQAVTNAAFGGADRKTLYITVIGSGPATGVFKVNMNLPGFPY